VDQQIKALLYNCLPKLAPHIELEVDKPILNFRDDSYIRLARIDANIPGVGMHFVVWDKWTPWFPFAPEVDGIVRPLTYIPYDLAWGISPTAFSRNAAENMGGHVQECLEEFCETMNLKTCTPLGRCVNNNRSQIGEPLASHILKYNSLSWNRAKHVWHTGLPESVISWDDALVCYFIARYLGAALLSKCGKLNEVVQAVENAGKAGHFYNRPVIWKL
jgi:hypothetical protein